MEQLRINRRTFMPGDEIYSMDDDDATWLGLHGRVDFRIVAESAVSPPLAAGWTRVQADITYWLVQFTEPVLADLKPSKLVEGTDATRITHALVQDESPSEKIDLNLAPGVPVYPVRGTPSSVADAEPFPGEGVKAFVRHSDFDEGRV